jgi:hypothetical protein
MPIRLLPSSGRLIGLFPDGADDNFLWTNPAPGGAWPNPGGDRTWLAPEIELFIGDVRRPGETYRVPPAMDPGNWQESGANRLTNYASLRMNRTGRDVSVRLGKEFLPAPSPVAANGLQYAGYTQVTSLETDAPLGIWNLLQLPPGGTMLVATRAPVRPKVVFGALGEGELTVAPELVYWRMALTGPDTKIAIKADALTGRAAYLRPAAAPGAADLVVREFAVDPAGTYVDALWAPPHETGWGFQACCVRNGREQFNELEYHAPAGCRRDESRVWGFRGPAADVVAAASVLMERDVGRCCRLI